MVATASIAAALGSDACSSTASRCTAPSSGTFSLSLTYSQTLPVDVQCPVAATQAATCAVPAQAWGGIVTVGSAGTSLASSDGGGQAGWSCSATAPGSVSVTSEDGGTPGTQCYLLVSCNQQGSASIGSLQFEIFAQASNPAVLALVQDSAGDCCVNEYTGTWN
jgi:hypothetical protein